MIQGFPGLKDGEYETTSPASVKYNCVAWAAGDNTRWWEPNALGNLYWPPSAPREWTIDGLVGAFKTLSYKMCDNGDLEDGYEKVAIYAPLAILKHAARQLPDGRWTSKLGDGVDVTHTLSGLQGSQYGSPSIFMRRRIRRPRKR